jgi:hypothetical protein
MEKSPKIAGPRAIGPEDAGRAACTQDSRARDRVQGVAPSTSGSPKPKVLDQLRGALRSRHYSRCTEQTYVIWVKRFTVHHNFRHPAEMDSATSTSPSFRKPSVMPLAEPGLPCERPATPCGTPSRRICWKLGTTSEPSRSVSGTKPQ